METLVTIKNGIYKNETVTGTFKLEGPFRPYTDSKIRSGAHRQNMGCTGIIKIFHEGAVRRVHVDGDNLEISETADITSVVTQPEPQVLTQKDIDAMSVNIANRFKVLDMTANAITTGIMRGLVISGAPGVGKTYTLEKKLKQAQEEGQIGNFEHIKGKVTALKLYETLFKNSSAGDVVLLDDTDDVFFCETSMNIIKAALDTSSGFVSYGSTCKYLEENDIPTRFDFAGTIVFITNYDFDRLISSNSKLTPHFKALMSRSTYLDLKIHSNLEIMIRVEQVATTTALMDSLGVTPSVAQEMVEWCWENYKNMREISIRTLHKLAEYSRIDNDWKFLASNFLLRG